MRQCDLFRLPQKPWNAGRLIGPSPSARAVARVANRLLRPCTMGSTSSTATGPAGTVISTVTGTPPMFSTTRPVAVGPPSADAAERRRTRSASGLTCCGGAPRAAIGSSAATVSVPGRDAAGQVSDGAAGRAWAVGGKTALLDALTDDHRAPPGCAGPDGIHPINLEEHVNGSGLAGRARGVRCGTPTRTKLGLRKVFAVGAGRELGVLINVVPVRDPVGAVRGRTAGHGPRTSDSIVGLAVVDYTAWPEGVPPPTLSADAVDGRRSRAAGLSPRARGVRDTGGILCWPGLGRAGCRRLGGDRRAR